MNIVILQNIDREGGGSRQSLSSTLQGLRTYFPNINILLVTREAGPVSILAKKLGYQHLIASFPRYRKPLERLPFHFACYRLSKKLKSFSPDLILSNEWTTAPHAKYCASHLGVHSVSYVRDFSAVKYGKKYLLHELDGLICVCESMRKQLINAGYFTQKTHTVYNAISIPSKSNDAEGIAPQLKAKFPYIDKWLLYLGRVSIRKNQIQAIDVLNSLNSISQHRWGLILAGDAEDEYLNLVKNRLSNNSLSEFVSIIGHVKNPSDWISATDAGILTSKGEGLARVLIESFILKKPSFSLPLDGLEDIYENDLSTYVSNSRKSEALAETICQYHQNLSDGDVLSSQIGERLELRHSLSGHTNQFVSILSTIRESSTQLR